MQKTLQEVNSQIADNLKDCKKELEFKYNDDSYSFNVLDGKGTGEGYRHIRHYNEEDEKVPLDGADPEEALITEVSAASFNGDGYAFLTSNLMDIPLLHSLGVNYLVTHNNAAILDYGQEFKNIKVCFVSKSEAGKEVVHNILDLGVQIIKVDFNEICPEYSEKDPLTTVAEKIQETGRDGVDTINKFFYRKYTDKAIVKSPEVSNTPDSHTASNKISIGVENSTTRTEAETNVGAAEQKNIKSLPIDKLINDKKYQSRVSENGSAIEELAVAYKAVEDIDPLEVVDTGNGTYIITDGHHRYAGAKIAEMDYIECHITGGTKLDAFKLSLGANESNKALKRTKEDKRNAVMLALNSNELKGLSHRKISDICKVSPGLVDKVAKERSKSDSKEEDSAYIGSQLHQTHKVNIEKSDNGAYIGSAVSSKSKPMTEKVTNEHISLSVTWKSKPSSGETMQGLLTDLQSIIDDYISDFKEAI